MFTIAKRACELHVLDQMWTKSYKIGYFIPKPEIQLVQLNTACQPAFFLSFFVDTSTSALPKPYRHSYHSYHTNNSTVTTTATVPNTCVVNLCRGSTKNACSLHAGLHTTVYRLRASISGADSVGLQCVIVGVDAGMHGVDALHVACL